MNQTTSKLVSIERAIEIMDCYGADTQAWPEDERTATQSLIKASTQLQQHLQQARQLDDALGKVETSHVAETALAARIITQLPPQDRVEPGSSSSSGTGPATRHHWQRSGMIAATVMLALVGYLLVQPESGHQQPQEILVQPALEQWMWDEVTENEELGDDEEAGLMAMIELEF